MFETMTDATFDKGLPTEENLDNWSGEHMLLILDDVMQEVCSSKNILSIFTIHRHLKNITVLFLTQNIFPAGKCALTIISELSLHCFIWKET